MEGWLDMLDEWGKYVGNSASYINDLKRLASDCPNAQTPEGFGMVGLLVRGQSTLYEVPAGKPLHTYRKDVLLGFRNTGHTDLVVTVKVECKLSAVTAVPAHSSRLAWHNNGIPARTPHFPGVWIDHQASPDLYYVFAFLDQETMKELCWGAWQFGSLRIYNGFVSNDPTRPYVSLPSGKSAWRVRMARKRKQQDVYQRELLAAACRPSRLSQIIHADELEEMFP